MENRRFSPDIRSTLDASALCKMTGRRQIVGGVLARTKGIVSPVAGQADILVLPDREAGNMIEKQLG